MNLLLFRLAIVTDDEEDDDDLVAKCSSQDKKDGALFQKLFCDSVDATDDDSLTMSGQGISRLLQTIKHSSNFHDFNGPIQRVHERQIDST